MSFNKQRFGFLVDAKENESAERDHCDASAEAGEKALDAIYGVDLSHHVQYHIPLIFV